MGVTGAESPDLELLDGTDIPLRAPAKTDIVDEAEVSRQSGGQLLAT